MKILNLIPATVLVALTLFSACRKTEILPPSPASPVTPAAYLSGPGLMYFGTPYQMLNEITCTQPCGVCHVSHRAPDYFPNTLDPDNNEGIMDVRVDAENHIVLSVDMDGVGHFYINEIESTQHLPVAVMTTVPQGLADNACDAAGYPHFQSAVIIPAGNYPVSFDEIGVSGRLDMAGTLNADGSWSWIFSMH